MLTNGNIGGAVTRTCAALNERGEACRQPPLRDAEVCFWHSPEHTEEAAEARRLGGLRRRREGTVSRAYDLEGLENVPQIRRVLVVAAVDALSLENTVARVRALIALAQAAAKLLETGELEERVEALEAAYSRPSLPEPVFDLDADDLAIAFDEEEGP